MSAVSAPKQQQHRGTHGTHGVRGTQRVSPPRTRGVSVGVDPRARVTAAQRTRIVAAAAGIVGKQGYAGMSVSHVTSRAGVSRRTFYEQFEDREACFLALFEQALALTSEVVSEAAFSVAGEGGGWHQQVRAGLHALLGLLEDDPALGSLLIVDPLGVGPKVLERRTRILETLQAIVDEGRTQAEPGSRRTSSSPPSPLTAEGIVGAVLSVVHARLLEQASTSPPANGLLHPRIQSGSLTGLVNPLMALIVLPYLGEAAAAKELAHPTPKNARRSRVSRPSRDAPANPLHGLDMRLTQRTLLVLAVIAEHPGASNRRVATLADIEDQGQISKLLNRLKRLGLIANTSAGQSKGEANAWELTPKGRTVEQALKS